GPVLALQNPGDRHEHDEDDEHDTDGPDERQVNGPPHVIGKKEKQTEDSDGIGYVTGGKAKGVGDDLEWMDPVTRGSWPMVPLAQPIGGQGTDPRSDRHDDGVEPAPQQEK